MFALHLCHVSKNMNFTLKVYISVPLANFSKPNARHLTISYENFTSNPAHTLFCKKP